MAVVSPDGTHDGQQNAEDGAIYDNTEDEPESEVDEEAPTQHQPVLTRRALLTRAHESRATLGVNPTARMWKYRTPTCLLRPAGTLLARS